MSDEQRLESKKCTPCSGGTARLRGKEIDTLLQKLGHGWRVVDEHHIEKDYEFPDFKHALKFTNEVGKIAEEEGHHPDIYLVWGKVRIALWTHKIHGLSESDFILAAKCDQAYSHFVINQNF